MNIQRGVPDMHSRWCWILMIGVLSLEVEICGDGDGDDVVSPQQVQELKFLYRHPAVEVYPKAGV